MGWGCSRSPNFHTWWMLRNCVSGARGHMLDASALMGFLGWGGVGMFTFAELAHLVAATQLRFWCPWTHAGCFGIDGIFGVGWGGDVHVRRTCTPGGCYATAFPWTHAGCFGIDGMFGVGWGGDVHVRLPVPLQQQEALEKHWGSLQSKVKMLSNAASSGRGMFLKCYGSKANQCDSSIPNVNS